MDDASKEFQTSSSDGRAQEQKEWGCIRKLESDNAALRSALVAAIHALKSYQFGNQSTELAEEVVAKIEKILESHDTTTHQA